jgi:ElaB/YqjD/DUF883 family membrane-anchored ribosome-binding protein
MMTDNRTDFDHGIPMSEDTAAQQETDLSGTGATGGATAAGGTSKVTEVKQLAKDNVSKVSTQAADKARQFAQQGQTKAGDALDQLSQMLTDAAGQVEEKLGGQYGGYARQAATTVQGFSDQVKNKDVDELIDDVRTFVRKSPAVAIGAAAAIGFVVARVVAAGIDAGAAAGTGTGTTGGSDTRA